MKKCMLLLTIVVSLAFSQDVYRLNDSTFVYPCIATDSTSFNLIGLPVQTDFINISDFDPEGINIEAVSRYDAQEQSWETAGYHPALGWAADYGVETGSAYLINAINDFDFIVSGDSVDVVYDLITTAGSDLNFLVHPLTKPDFTMAVDILDGVNNCAVVNKYDNISQQWYGCSRAFFMLLGNFPTEPGRPLMLQMNGDTTWPSEKYNDSNININEAKNIPKYSNSQPRVVYINLVNSNTGEPLIYPDETKLIEFSAYINERYLEKINENTYGCGFTEVNGHSVAYINLGNFVSSWNPGEELHFEISNIDEMWGYDCDIIIDELSTSIFHGFEPLIADSGLPGQIDMDHVNPLTTPQVTSNVQNGIITLDWGYISAATEFYIYSSDDPYGTFTYFDTAIGISWSTELTEDRKFFQVVTSNAKGEIPPKTIVVKQEK